MEYRVGDLVLLTKKRQGLIRYVGKTDFDGGEETWFGIELLGGSIGHMDGQLDGKRYFETRKDGGVLILINKILRKLNRNELIYKSDKKNESNSKKSKHQMGNHKTDALLNVTSRNSSTKTKKSRVQTNKPVNVHRRKKSKSVTQLER